MANREATMIVDVDTDRTETTVVSNAVTPTASEAGADAEGLHTEAQASLGQQPQVEAQASLGQQPQVETQASLGQQPQEEAQAVSEPAEEPLLSPRRARASSYASTAASPAPEHGRIWGASSQKLSTATLLAAETSLACVAECSRRARALVAATRAARELRSSTACLAHGLLTVSRP